MIWYILIALSIIFYSLVNVTDKIVSNWNNKKFSLVLRYFFSLVASFGILTILWEKLIYPQMKLILVLMIIWSMYYYINIIMYKWLKHLSTWTFYMIWYSYLIFLFFVNIAVYWKSEILSPLKTFFAFIFIAYILSLAYKSWTEKWKSDLLWYIIAIICSLWWTVCIFIEGYYIKNSIMSPTMVIFLMYSGSFLTAWINYFINNKENISEIIWNPKKLLISSSWWILIVLWAVFLLYSYKYIQLNIANTVSTSEIFFTTFFAIIFLKEKHSKKEIINILIWFILLIIFVFLG